MSQPTNADLQPFGYAEGWYTGTCRDCQMRWDCQAKGSWRCQECATKAFASKPTSEANRAGQALDLEACPICGSETSRGVFTENEINERDDNGDQWAVCCDATAGGCGTVGPYEDNDLDAIAAWNRRPVVQEARTPAPEAVKLVEIAERLQDAIVMTNNRGQGWEINGEAAALVPIIDLQAAITALSQPLPVAESIKEAFMEGAAVYELGPIDGEPMSDDQLEKCWNLSDAKRAAPVAAEHAIGVREGKASTRASLEDAAYQIVKSWQGPLWDAVNAYMHACGGHWKKGGEARIKAVSALNRTLEILLAAYALEPIQSPTIPPNPKGREQEGAT